MHPQSGLFSREISQARHVRFRLKTRFLIETCNSSTETCFFVCKLQCGRENREEGWKYVQCEVAFSQLNMHFGLVHDILKLIYFEPVE